MALEDYQNKYGGGGPKGLQQQSQGPAWSGWGGDGEIPDAQQPKQPRWNTGGQRGSLENGWNTELNRTFMQQYQEQAEQGKLRELYDRPDFTGVVTMNQGDKKVGDVYENGKLTSNLYQTQSQADADMVVGSYLLDEKVMSRIQSPQELRTAVADASKKQEQEFVKGAGAADFETEVKDRVKEWDEDGSAGWRKAGNVLGTTAGGVAMGSRGGIWGMIGAGAAGLVGGILNQDELLEQAARNEVMIERAQEEANGATSAFQWLQAAGTMGAKYLQPVNNLVHGAYETVEGGIGDGTSDWYKTDGEGNSTREWGWDVAHYASMVPDALGTFGTSAGLKAFQGTMGANIIGQTGTLVSSGGETFDDRRGGFDSILTDDDGNFSLGSTAAGVGAIGIDAVQMFGAGGLMKAAKDQLKIFGGSGTKAANETVNIAGWKYTLDDAGNATSRSLSGMSWMAPSEALQATTVGMQARIAARGAKPTADDYYQQAVRLQSGVNPRATVAVNAIGEAYEEGVQAVLEPWSHHADVDMAAVADAMLSGGMMGGGMGLAATAQGMKTDKILRGTADMLRVSAGEKPFTDAQWTGLTPSEKAARASRNPLEAAALKESTERIAAAQEAVMVADHPALQRRAADAALARMTKDMNSAAPRTDESFRISQATDSTSPEYAATTSIRGVEHLLTKSWQGLEIARDNSTNPEEVADLTAVLDQAEVLKAELQELLTAYDAATDLTTKNAEIDKINATLDAWFNGTSDPTLDPETITHRSRAATAFFTRHPTDNPGSVQALMPFVHKKLSEFNADYAMQVGLAILDPMGGDFDGDKVQHMARIVIDNANYRSMRQGIGFQSVEGKFSLPERAFEKQIAVRVRNAAMKPEGSASHGKVKQFNKDVTALLQKRYGSIEGFMDHVPDFLADFASGNPEARIDFTNKVFQRYGTQMMEIDPTHLTNEGIWIFENVGHLMTKLQSDLAGYEPVLRNSPTLVTPPRKNTEAFSYARASAATFGANLANASEGAMMFRITQMAKYTVDRVNEYGKDMTTENNPAMQQHVETLHMLEEGLRNDQSILETSRAENAISARTLAKLEIIADETGLDIHVVAAMQVQNVDSAGVFHSKQGEESSVTMLQLLLREEVQREEASLGEFVQTVPEVAQRLATLKGLTRPNRLKSKADSNANKQAFAGAAFLEVFGENALHTYLPEAARTVGTDMTYGQLHRRLRSLSVARRKEEIDALRNSPAYGESKKRFDLPFSKELLEEEGITAYRILVDSVEEAVNFELSVIHSGENAGRPTGRMAASSKRTSDSVQTIVANLEKAVAAEPGLKDENGVALTGAARTSAFLHMYPEWMTGIAESFITDRVAPAFFLYDGDGKVEAPTLLMARWLTEAMNMPPKEAEMHLLRNMVLASWRAAETNLRKGEDGSEEQVRAYEKLDDRLHQLMALLSTHPDGGFMYEAFIRDFELAKSTDDFVKLLNTKYAPQFGMAPFTAWIRDVDEFDPDRAPGSLNQRLDGAKERATINEFADRTKGLLAAAAEKRRNLKADQGTLGMLRQAYAAQQDGTLVQGSQLAEARTALLDAIAFANLNITMMSPADFENAMVGATTQLYRHAASKGNVPAEYRGMGSVDAARDSFATPLEQTMNSLLSRDLDDTINRPNILASGPLELTDTDGTPIRWGGLTEEFVLENYSKPEGRAFINRILFPTVLASGPEGRGASVKYLMEPSLTTLVSGEKGQNFYQQLLEGSKTRLATVVSGMSTAAGERQALENIVNDVMIAQLGSYMRPMSMNPEDSSSATALLGVTQNYVIDLLAMAGDLASSREVYVNDKGEQLEQPSVVEDPKTGEKITKLELAKRELRRTLRDKHMREMIGSDTVQLLGSDVTRSQVKEALKDRRVSLADRFFRGEAKAEDLDAAQKYETLIDAIMDGDLVDAMIEIFGYHDGVKGKEARKEYLNGLVLANPSIAGAADSWAGHALHQVLDAALTKNEANSQYTYNSKGVPNLPDSTWTLISRAIIADRMQDISGVRGPVDMKLPEFPDFTKAHKDPSIQAQLASWDPTRYRILEPLLSQDNLLVQSMATIYQRSRKLSKADVSTFVARAMEPFARGEDRKKNTPNFGRWTLDEPLLAKEGPGRFRSSGSEAGVAMGGQVPKKEWTFSARWTRTFLAPDPANASSLLVPAHNLLAGDNVYSRGFISTHPSGATSNHEPLAMLNGRFATDVLVDGVSIFNGFGDNPGLGDVWPHTKGERLGNVRAITLAQLDRAVEAYINSAGVDSSKAVVEIKYFHPDTRPAGKEWYGNVYYDGLGTEVAASDSYSSLNTSLWVAPGAINRMVQQWGLQAAKKGLQAIQFGKTGTDDLRKAHRAGWKTNISSFLHLTAASSMEMQEGRTEELSPMMYNAVLQQVRRATFVRGIDKETGEPVLLTADEVARRQLEQPSYDISDEYDSAELYIPSRSVLRSLYGDRREFSTDANSDLIPAPTYNEAPTFDGTFSERDLYAIRGALQVDPETGTWATRDILDSSLATREEIGTYRSGRGRQAGATFNRIRKLQADRSRTNAEIHLKRQEMRTDFKKIRDQNAAIVQDSYRAAPSTAQLNSPIGAFPESELLSQEFDRVAWADQTAVGNTMNDGVIWLVSKKGIQGQTVNQGVVDEANVRRPHGTGFSYASDTDIAAVDVTSWRLENGELDLKGLQNAVNEIVPTGVPIHIYDGTGASYGLLAQAREFMRTIPTYSTAEGGSRDHFVEDLGDYQSANERNRTSALFEMNPIRFSRMMISFETRSFNIDENTALQMYANNDKSGRVLQTISVLPTIGYGDFSVPVNPATIADVQTSLRDILTDPERSLALATASGVKGQEQLEEWTRSAEDLLTQWTQNDGTDGMWPEYMRKGTIVPLVSTTGGKLQIALYRHGYKAPKRSELDEALLKAEDQESGIGARVVAFPPQETGSELTVFEGRVNRVSARAKFGHEVELEIPLRNMGSKWQFNHAGFKVVVSPRNEDEHKMPSVPLYNSGRGIDLIVSADNTASKQSQHGTANTMRTTLAYFGHDWTPYLVEYFTGKTPKDGSDYAVAVNKTIEALKKLERMGPRLSTKETLQFLEVGALPKNVAEGMLSVGGLSQAQYDMLTSLPADQARKTALAGIVRPVIGYILASEGLHQPGRYRYEHILKSSGIGDALGAEADTRGQLMPPIVTDALDRLPFGHPTRALIETDLNAQLPWDGKTGYFFDQAFMLHAVAEDGTHSTGYLKFNQVFTSGDNTATDEFSHGRGDRQKVGETLQTLLNLSYDAYNAADKDVTEAASSFYQGDIPPITSSSQLWTELRAVEPRKGGVIGHKNAAELLYIAKAEQVGSSFREEIDFKAGMEGRAYRPEEIKEFETEFGELSRKARSLMNLNESQNRLLHHFIRQYLGSGAPRREGEREVTYPEAIGAMKEIIRNIEEYKTLPTAGGAVPMLHHTDLAALYTAAQSGSGLQLRIDKQGGLVEKGDWEGWVAAAIQIGDYSIGGFDAMFITPTDHMLHSYLDKEATLSNFPVTLSMARKTALFDPETNRIAYSLSGDVTRMQSEPLILDQLNQSFASQFGMEVVGDRWHGIAPSISVLSKKQAARAKYRKDNRIASPQHKSMRDYRKSYRMMVEKESTTNAITRIAMDLRAGTALINPTLWVSAFFEAVYRSGLDFTADAILGDTLLQGGSIPGHAFNRKQQKEMRRAVSAIGSRNEFKAFIFGELMYVPDYSGRSKVERFTKGLARMGGTVFQDPTWGMPGSVLATHYFTAVLAWVRQNPGIVASPENIMSRAMTDPSWVKEHIPGAHKAALAKIADLRSLKQTTISMFMNSLMNPASKSSNGFMNFLGNWTGKMPFMFLGYATNVMITQAGLQGPNAMIAALMHGRKNHFKTLQDKIARRENWRGEGETGEYIDMSAVLEGIDLSKMFIKGGVTHTGLFMAGMLAGTLGLDGEDEEERRLRRAAEYQKGIKIHDPESLANDWRNQDAIFLDGIPLLQDIFRSPDVNDPEGGRAMAQLHWTVKQFVSPVLGMQKFFDTGDIRQLIWGFQDAVGEMPLINTMTWDATNKIANAVMEDVPKDAEASAQLAQLTFGALSRTVMAYESMLFESSFVNQLYQTWDRYDRDPWQIAKMEDGRIFRDDLGVPQKTDILNEFVDPETGELREGTQSRDWWDAQLHGFTENRATLAGLMALFDGTMNGGGVSQSSYLRGNMVAKTNTIEKDTMSEDQAASLVVGLYQNAGGNQYAMSYLDPSGREVLNENGAEAVIRGVWKQSLSVESPALQGAYIPLEMRDVLQAKFMEELIREGLNAGLSEYDAKGYMYEVWYGPRDNPGVPGLKDILWDDRISYSPNEKYYQLNTTYVMGPDGRVHATGFAREKLHSAFGFAPLMPTIASTETGLPADGRQNSVDPGLGANLGLRGQEKITDSRAPISKEEIAERIEKAITQAMNKPVSDSTNGGGQGGYGGDGYGRFGGGGYSRGGGGYSSSPYNYRLSSPERNNPVYSSNDPIIRPDDPIIRRATVRRERYTSTRGRINQWQ